MSIVKKLSAKVSCSSDIPTLSPYPDDDETCGFEIGCGSCKSKRYPVRFCQMFATTRWALVFFSLGAVIQGFLVNGHTSVVISTLEKRFELTSTESGLIASCYDIAGSVTILFVTYVGGHGHKPMWVGWGIFLIGISGIMFSLPHFLAPAYEFIDASNLCGAAALESCTISALKNFRFLFYGALIVAGVGSSPIYSLGITFLDENVKQRYSSTYTGILIAMSIVGPGIGYLVGAAFLRIYTFPEESVNINSTSENWVGAWWIGPFLFGFIGLLIAIPVIMLPKVIPGTEKHRQERKKEMHKTAVENEDDPVYGKRFKDFPKVVLQLFRNPTYVFQTLGVSLDALIVGGLGTFGPKYMETQFGLTPSDAGTYFGILAILGGAGGQVAGGATISKFNVGLRKMLHICYIAPLIAFFCSFSYFITCSDPQLAGVTTSYRDIGSSSANPQIQSSCNSNCECSSAIYSPVCGTDGLSYFSPCLAGCTGQENGVYVNCTCVAATPIGPPYNISQLSTASVGACLDEECSSSWHFIVFCIFNFLLMFLTFFNEAASLQVSLRCVAFRRRSFAIGVQILMWRVLGTIPGPLVVGAIFDNTCQQWTEECGERGSCIHYDNQKLSIYLLLFIAICKLVDVFLFLAGLFTYKPVEDAMLSEDTESDDVSDSKNTNKLSNSNAIDSKTTLPGENHIHDLATPNDGYLNASFSNGDAGHIVK